MNDKLFRLFVRSKKMAQLKTPQERIDELSIKNKDLANSVQYWRVEHKRVEDEKFLLQKENTMLTYKNKEYGSRIKEGCLSLQKRMFEFSKEIERIIKEIDGNSFEISSRECFLNSRESSGISFSRESSGSSVNNIHQVRPMINGVLLKKAVLKMKRTNIDFLNKKYTETSNINNSTNSLINALQNGNNIKLQEVSVPLERLDTSVMNEYTSVQRDNDNSNTNVQNISPERIRRGPFVSLSRIESVGKKSPCNNIDNNRKSDVLSPETPSKKYPEGHIQSRRSSLLSEDTISENKENSFINHDEFMDDFEFSEHNSFDQGLDCISEVTETNSCQTTLNNSSTMHSPKSMNKKHIFSERTTKSSNTEDPLEGTSWSFNNREYPSTVQNNTEEQIQNSDNYECDLMRGIDQMSNSTIDENDLDKSDVTREPTFQSTPKVNNHDSDQNTASYAQIDETIITDNVPLAAEEAKEDSTKKKKPAKRSSRVKNKVVTKSKNTKKSNSKVKRTSSPSRRKTSNTSVPCVNDNSTFIDGDDILENRSRRRVKINYKEISAKVKLRRN